MVELDLYDLIVLYCVVNFPTLYAEVLREKYPDLTPDQITRMARRKPGIAALWGNKDTIPNRDWGDRPIPEGLINRMVLQYRIGAPLMHAKQFYRIEKTLRKAGLLVDIPLLHFMHNKRAIKLVEKFLDDPNPNHWPVKLIVQDGQALEMATL